MVDKNEKPGHEPGRRLTERVFGRVVGSVVSPVVDNVDVDEVVERIDVNHLMERLDLDELIGRIDVDGVMHRVDIDALLARVDINQLVGRIDVDQVMHRVDIDALMARVDINELVDRIEPDRLLDRIDVDHLLSRIDANALIERVDANALIERVDMNGIIDRVDVDRVMARVDVNSIVERTELGLIIARSTTGVFGQLLDVARTQLIVVDQMAQAVPARFLRGQAREVPQMPSGEAEVGDLKAMTLSQRAVALQRHAAGSVSRFSAFLLDQFIIGILFAAGLMLTSAALQVVIGVELGTDDDSALIAVAYVTWSFIYVAGSLAATGRTIGKAVLGLLVVQSNGDRLHSRGALVRTIVFPLSFLVFGLGLLVGLIRHDRREMHDLIAGTAVIYAWDAATAQLRMQTTEP